MGTNSSSKPITAEALSKLWPFVLALVTVASAWGVASVKASYQETRICVLEAKADRTQEAFAQIQTQLAEIQRDLQYLRRDLDRQSTQE